MRYFIFLLLGGYCSLGFAVDTLPKNQVYNASSQTKVAALNKVTEVLRDPTAMSENFRKALRNLPANSPVQSGTDQRELKDLGLPEIEMVGKIFSENAPATVVLKANGKYHHFEEGDQISRVINDQVVTLHVQEISKHNVRLLIMPFNKTLIFN